MRYVKCKIVEYPQIVVRLVVVFLLFQRTSWGPNS